MDFGFQSDDVKAAVASKGIINDGSGYIIVVFSPFAPLMLSKLNDRELLRALVGYGKRLDGATDIVVEKGPKAMVHMKDHETGQWKVVQQEASRGSH